MNTRRPILMLLILFCGLALTGSVEGLSFAAQKKPADQNSSSVPPKAHKTLGANTFRHASARVTKRDQPSRANAGILPKTAVVVPAKPLSKANRHAINVQKKDVPKAAVQPRTDLTYYGVLEDSQRYDPRPNSRMAGVPSPQTSDLTHDHFQELDRNQDGKIDPVERAFGRIDMDRDLHNRQLQ